MPNAAVKDAIEFYRSLMFSFKGVSHVINIYKGNLGSTLKLIWSVRSVFL